MQFSSNLVFAFLLWLSIMSQYSTDTKTFSPEHLCTKIANGHFDRIYIKSITVYRVGLKKNLLIFEHDKKHYVELSQITNTSMELSLNDFQWNSEELRQGVRAMVHKKRLNISQVSSIYMIYYGEKWGLPGKPKGTWNNLNIRFRSTYLVLLLYTNSTLFSMDILSKKVDLFPDHQNVHPNFALLQFQPEDTITLGFVIHKDIYGLTDQLILYDIKYDLMEKVDIHRKTKITQKEREKAIYYYLEKGRKAKTVDLVPRSVRNSTSKVEPSAQLVGSSVPRGFVLNGNLYLIDTSAGCVYVIGGNIASVELAKAYKEQPNKTLTFPVAGIPFESFFKCPASVSVVQPYPHKADRCEPKRNVAPVDRPLVVNTDSTDIFVSVLLPVLLFLMVLVGLCITGWYYFFGQSPTDDVLPQGLNLKTVQAELKKRMKQAGNLSSGHGASSSVDNDFSTSKVMHSKCTNTNSNVSSANTQT